MRDTDGGTAPAARGTWWHDAAGIWPVALALVVWAIAAGARRGWFTPVVGLLLALAAGGLGVVALRLTASRRAARPTTPAGDTQGELKAVVASIGEGLIIADAGGRLTYWNPAALRMHGYEDQSDLLLHLPEFEKTFRLDSLDGRILPTTEWPLARILKGEVLEGVDLRVTRLDRAWQRVFRYGGGLIERPGDAPLAFLTVVDVTGRVEDQLALRASEERMRGIVETAPVSIWQEDWSDVRVLLADAELRTAPAVREYCRHHPEFVRHALEAVKILDVNAWTVSLFGAQSKDDMLASLQTVFATPDTLPGFVDELAAFADGATSLMARMRMNTVSGTVLHVAKGMSFPAANAASPRVLVSLVDLTAREDAEAARRESEARFEQLADAIEEVFWLTDVAKQEMIYISPAYHTIWGRSREGLYASPGDWMEAIHPDDRERIRTAAHTRQELGTYDEEYRVVRPDGAIRWIRDRAFPVRDATGRIFRMAGVAEDITGRRDLEAQVLQTQKMESVGRLAGGVAHDFNNMLTAIRGNVELMKDLVVDNAEANRMLGEIGAAVDRAAALTRQLLAFSRQEMLRPQVVDLNVAVAEVETMLRRLIGEDIEVHATLDPELRPVQVDPGHLVQVLMNLAVNARDAMPNGGHLTIETHNAELGAEYASAHAAVKTGPYAMISVTDTGIGMSPAVQQRIFEPFYTTKPAAQGTGLGLSVVEGIIRQSEGHVQVYSEPGVGTTFRIYLPALVGAAAAAVAPRDTAPRGGSETVLVVEDDDAVRKIAAQVLASRGYRVLAASNGELALRAMQQDGGRIDLLVTDVVMPVMDGRQLAERLQSIQPRARVLYTSGYTDDAVVRHGVLHANVAFLPKPYTPTSLARKVREVLDAS